MDKLIEMILEEEVYKKVVQAGSDKKMAIDWVMEFYCNKDAKEYLAHLEKTYDRKALFENLRRFDKKDEKLNNKHLATSAMSQLFQEMSVLFSSKQLLEKDEFMMFYLEAIKYMGVIASIYNEKESCD